MSAICDALDRRDYQVVAVLPNADFGNSGAREELLSRQRPGRFTVSPHIRRSEFVSWMAACDVMIGNSSAGIIEAATFGTPVVNVGDRQAFRERNANVIDCEALPTALDAALETAAGRGRYQERNVYGDGRAGARAIEILAAIDLDRSVLRKLNAY
jgi:GDP/UDP-N,N'-diacetylbacillosamine 2-epimerase (hydrolysing)